MFGFLSPLILGGTRWQDVRTIGKPRLAADAPIKVFNDSAWAVVPGITGTGDMGNPYVIADMVIDAGGIDVGIWIENTTKAFTIQNCSVTGGMFPYGGIYVANASNAVISGNNCSRNSVGIQLDRQCKNVTIEKNNATGNDYYGIIVFNNSSLNIITQNNATGNIMSGILISTLSNANSIHANNASANGHNGISLVQTAAWNIVSQNNCSGNTRHGIGFESNAANNTVLGNLILSNLLGGIRLTDAKNNSVADNNATSNNGPGIFLEGNAANNSVTSNILASNVDGICLTSSAKNNSFSGNNVTTNTNRGVNVTAGADGNWFYGNSFSGNGIGQSWDAGAFNHWNNGSTGNFWGDYAGVDANDDLAGDTPYTIGGPTGAKDNYPYCDDGNDIAPNLLSTGLPAFAGTAAPAFALNLIEAYLDKIWVSYDGGATNHSCGMAGTLPQWSALGNGTCMITFWTNDTDNFVGTIAVLLHKDIIAPTLVIPSPVTGSSFTGAPTFSVTVEDAQLDLTWYTIGSDPTKHYFTGLTGTIDAGSWATVPAGEVTITFYADDTLGNERAVPVTVVKAVSVGWGWVLPVGIGIVVVIAVGIVIKRRKTPFGI